MLVVLLTLLAIAAAWLWLSSVRVSPKPVAMMATRISFPGGLRVHDPDRALAVLDRPDEIVIPFDQAVLVIDYPLTTPATVEIHAPIENGFTRAELVKAICEEYANVYEAEEGTAATKTVPPEERAGNGGRNRTDGAYGIWGHDLKDLVLTAARWTRQASGIVTIELFIER